MNHPNRKEDQKEPGLFDGNRLAPEFHHDVYGELTEQSPLLTFVGMRSSDKLLSFKNKSVPLSEESLMDLCGRIIDELSNDKAFMSALKESSGDLVAHSQNNMDFRTAWGKVLVKFRDSGLTYDPSPGELMFDALNEKNSEKLKMLREVHGESPPMSLSDRDIYPWAPVFFHSKSFSIYDKFANTVLDHWKEGWKEVLIEAGFDMARFPEDQNKSWGRVASEICSVEAARDLVDDIVPDVLAEAAVSVAHVEGLAFALSRGANPKPLLRVCLTKERVLSGKDLMTCAGLLVGAGASHEDAIKDGECLFEDYLNGWGLWDVYFSESGLPWDFLLRTKNGEKLNAQRIIEKSALWLASLIGEKGFFDEIKQTGAESFLTEMYKTIRMPKVMKELLPILKSMKEQETLTSEMETLTLSRTRRQL